MSWCYSGHTSEGPEFKPSLFWPHSPHIFSPTARPHSQKSELGTYDSTWRSDTPTPNLKVAWCVDGARHVAWPVVPTGGCVSKLHCYGSSFVLGTWSSALGLGVGTARDRVLGSVSYVVPSAVLCCQARGVCREPLVGENLDYVFKDGRFFLGLCLRFFCFKYIFYYREVKTKTKTERTH